ncbi:MAG: hypothetical protein ACKO38_11305, partial [Planctomycetota bacterium]
MIRFHTLSIALSVAVATCLTLEPPPLSRDGRGVFGRAAHAHPGHSHTFFRRPIDASPAAKEPAKTVAVDPQTFLMALAAQTAPSTGWIAYAAAASRPSLTISTGLAGDALDRA